MILVTGGAGYIGSIAAERLLSRGFEVCVYDNLSRGHRASIPKGAVFVEADLADRARLRETLAAHKITAVMHFAAHALVGESMTNAALYFRSILGNSLVLLEECQAAGVERFVFSSTCAIFGDKVASPITEDLPKSPINPYGEAKLAVERALSWYHHSHNLAYFALRYFNACGATGDRGELHDPETHLIPLVLRAAAGETEGIRIFGDDYRTPDGTCIRDYIHVEDLADAHILALEAPPELAGCYNLGTGRGHSVREVIDTARRITGRPIDEISAPKRPGDPPELVADPARFKNAFQWKPRHNLESAIESAWRFKLKLG